MAMGVGEGEETEGAAVEAAMAEEACQSWKVSKAKGRFTHLLEPIRSLADNWSVDIACELEAYLEELEDLCCAEEEEVTQSTEGPADGGDDVVMEKKKFSFAKAALLVQGSTYVYSKKVEYLYSLVVECIERVLSSGRRRACKDRLHGTDNAAAEDDEDLFLLEGNEEAYLNLDDHVTLVNAGRGGDDGLQLDLDEEGEENLMEVEGPPQEHSAIMIALQNSQSNRHLGSDDNIENQGAFNLSAFTVHESGALLLEGNAHGAQLDGDLMPVAADDEAGLPQADLPPASPFEDFMDAGGAFDEGEFAEDAAMADVETTPAARAVAGRAVVPAPAAAGGDDGEDEELDPYEPLDPEDQGKWREKPFRRGRTQLRLGGEGASGGTMAEASDDGPSSWFAVPARTEFPDLFRSRHRRQRRERRTQAVLAEEEDGMGGAPGVEEEVDFGYGGEADFGEDLGHEEVDFDVDAVGPEAPPAVAAEEDGTAGEPTYEEMCRHHVERLMSAAETQARQTDLAQRVFAWKKKVEPALRRCEQHGDFNIKEYREAMRAESEVDSKGDVEECLQQTSVLASSQVHEVCRKFLALLMIKSDASVTLEDFQAIGKENEAEDGMVGAGKTLGKRLRTPLEAAEGHA